MTYNYNQWRFVFQLHQTGYSIRDLAKWLGVAPYTVQRNFARYEFRAPLRKELPPLSEYNKKFVELGDK